GREGDDETEKEWYENEKNAKRRDVEKEKEKEGCCSDVGVFDFPWLKDGVRSKSEEYFLDFEDNFSSLLEEEDASWKGNSSVDLLKAYGLFESPEEKLDHIAWQPFESDMVEHEAEDIDCIWSSLLRHPL
ncbi:hypothetical protein VIGAN_01538000, partial [Vigna angularis var. angularis]